MKISVTHCTAFWPVYIFGHMSVFVRWILELMNENIYWHSLYTNEVSLACIYYYIRVTLGVSSESEGICFYEKTNKKGIYFIVLSFSCMRIIVAKMQTVFHQSVLMKKSIGQSCRYRGNWRFIRYYCCEKAGTAEDTVTMSTVPDISGSDRYSWQWYYYN